MEHPEAVPGAAAGGGAAPMSFFQRLWGILMEPSKTWEDIARKRSWLGLYLVMVVLTLGATYTLMTRMPRETYLRKQAAMSMRFMKHFLPAQALEQAEAQIQAQTSRPATAREKYLPAVMTPVMLLLGYTIMTLIFLLAFKLMDAGITYRKSFTATIWGLGPPGIVVTLLSLLFISIKDPESLDINYINNVVSNLGILAESETHPALNALLSSFDLFTIWTVVLLSMGFAAMSEGKLAVRKAATPIVSLWVLWVVLKTGFWALLG